MDDLVDRQAAIDAAECIEDHHAITPYKTMAAAIDHLKRILNGMPSAQPERKKGRWKQWEEYGFEDTYECTACKTSFVLIDGTPMDNEYYFCPHCGACMTEERESEQK